MLLYKDRLSPKAEDWNIRTQRQIFDHWSKRFQTQRQPPRRVLQVKYWSSFSVVDPPMQLVAKCVRNYFMNHHVSPPNCHLFNDCPSKPKTRVWNQGEICSVGRSWLGESILIFPRYLTDNKNIGIYASFSRHSHTQNESLASEMMGDDRWSMMLEVVAILCKPRTMSHLPV